MLEVVLTDGQKITAYIGDYVKGREIRMCAYSVGYVFADGDEYLHIQRTYEGLPSNKRGSQASYYGDHAKFIAGNWMYV